MSRLHTSYSFLRICLILLVGLFSDVISYTIPDATLEIIKPKGFRISIPDEEGITEVSYNVKIGKRISLYQPGDYAATIVDKTNGSWAFDNINTNIEVGNLINFWIHVRFGELEKNFRVVQSITVSPDTQETSISCAASHLTTVQSCPTKCESSLTTVGGKPACRGQLIFEDNFESMDWTKWEREVRMPLVVDDGEFVSFQNRNENCYVSNGQLHIIPTLLSDISGYDEQKMLSGKLDLGQQCTAIVDRSQECVKRAKYYHTLPPVVSARIRTRKSFSFRYGKVEIRAKLPKGDWLFPLVLLEPLENFYGVQGYASGQIRIVFARGNEILKDKSGKDISNKVLSRGVVMTNDEKLRSDYLKGIPVVIDTSKDFHTYTLKWTENQFSFTIDGDEFTDQLLGENFSKIQKQLHGNTNENDKMAPFDREFYLTLGVSAGGHSDFPNDSLNGLSRSPKPWKNDDPKAQFYFWKDRSNWYRTWESDKCGLHVDYIRVYAL